MVQSGPIILMTSITADSLLITFATDSTLNKHAKIITTHVVPRKHFFLILLELPENRRDMFPR